MKTGYTNKELQYTNPQQYDQRANHPTEKYVQSLWQPILLQAIKKYITSTSVVCDLGCGTLEHTQYMQTAKHIFAVDSNQAMTTHGQTKIASFSSKVTILTTNALHTTVPTGTCNVIWSVGLSEYVPLPELWSEINRISAPHARVVIQFPNAHSPYNLIMRLAYKLTGRPAKTFRSLQDMRSIAKLHGWQLIHTTSCGLVLPAPRLLSRYLWPLWQFVEKIVAPIQPTTPIGLNVLAIFER